MTKHRPGARPARSGKGPKNNPSKGNAGRNKPNTGAKTGSTGKGTQHKGAKKESSCPLEMVVALPAIVLVMIFYALPRLALDTWRDRR